MYRIYVQKKIYVHNQLSKGISEKFFLLIQGADYEPKNKYKKNITVLPREENAGKCCKWNTIEWTCR